MTRPQGWLHDAIERGEVQVGLPTRGLDEPLLPATPRLALDQPVCRYCGGRGYYIGGDELHVCWCRQPDEEAE